MGTRIFEECYTELSDLAKRQQQLQQPQQEKKEDKGEEDEEGALMEEECQQRSSVQAGNDVDVDAVKRLEGRERASERSESEGPAVWFDHRRRSLEWWHAPTQQRQRQAPKRLVYLTADANEVLESLEDDCCYIIGGIVDRNRSDLFDFFWFSPAIKSAPYVAPISPSFHCSYQLSQHFTTCANKTQLNQLDKPYQHDP